jgi:hypothetical protein
MKSILYLLPFCLLLSQTARGQCISIVNCPSNGTQMCDYTTNDPLLWNSAFWYDSGTASPDRPEGEADLNIVVQNDCPANLVQYRYQLFLDLDGTGIPKTVVDSKTPPPPGGIYLHNASHNSPYYTGGVLTRFDQRNVPANQRYRFDLQVVSTTSDTKTLRVIWRSGGIVSKPQLPYGTHRIKWLIQDAAGHTATCEYTFTVKDCGKPSITCVNNLQANIMPTGMLQLSTTDFLASATDNITPSSQLKLAVRRMGEGTGFPVDSSGNPQTTIFYTCSELGSHTVELWARDKAGNTNYCETSININDNSLNCQGGAAQFKMCVKDWAHSQPVENFYFQIMDTNLSFVAGENGGSCLTHLPAQIGQNATISVASDENSQQQPSVGSMEAVLIYKFIQGQYVFDSPWQYVAADADRNGVIDTNDVNLCLNSYPYTSLPNPSRRFIRSDYVFPANPLQNPLPETIKLSELLQASPNPVYFTAVRLCDILGYYPFAPQDVEDRTAPNLQVLEQNKLFPPSPNPVTESATIQLWLTSDAATQVALYDLSGRQVYTADNQMSRGNGTIVIPAEAFPYPGVYLWKVKLGESNYSGKLIKS